VKKPSNLLIGDLGTATDVKVETIRYYERIGLFPAPGRTAGNYRTYDTEHLSRLSFIRRARELGFSIAEVRELLGLAERRESSCTDVDRLVGRHLATVEQKISALKRLRGELRETVAACNGGRIAKCSVIQALSPPIASTGEPWASRASRARR
jgi:DNA-binding transcriptional MerR regulator